MSDAELQDERRWTPKGRATRARIVEAAANLIIDEGLSALNMVNVREAASASGSQLAHYFVDKQALIRAVIDRQMEVVLDFHHQPKLHGLESFEDFERWIDMNMRYLRRIGYYGTPTFHALAGRLAKSDEGTREALATAYWRWVELLEQSIRRMKDRGLLVKDAVPRQLALVIVSAHQGGGTMAFTYRQEWPHASAVRFAVNYLRMFAADPAERIPRPPHRLRGQPKIPWSLAAGGDAPSDTSAHLTAKGLQTRERIVDATTELMFRRGVAGTSLIDVRSKAAVSGSQLSHYFQDKRDLTREVIAARRRDVIAFHTQPRLGSLDSLAALQAWADACVADADAIYRRGGCVYGSLVGELLEADDDVLGDLVAGYDQWLALFLDGLAAMRGRGDLRPDAEPRHLAVVLVAAHQGGAMVTYATGSAEPVRAAVNAAVDYVRSFAPSEKPGRSRKSKSRATPPPH